VSTPGGTAPNGPLEVSLVLGSGGARGYAHIGVIEELAASGISVRSIAGSSMGALIGGIHAAGKLDAYRDWVLPLQRFDVLRLLDWTLSGGGFIKGERIVGVLRDLIGDIAIEDLPIPYTAVAVDLDAQREVWFSRGSLFEAIRASIAIPTVFRPYPYEGRLLVDGGLLNPLPVSATLRDLTAATIAVDVNAPAEPQRPGLSAPDASGGSDHGAAGQATPEMLPGGGTQPPSELALAGYRERIAGFVDSLMPRHADGQASAPAGHDPGVFELFSRSLDLVQATITRLKIAAQPPDLLITIPRNACAFYEFHRARELIELGRVRTREALARWAPPARARRHPGGPR
jgi:NTE family protein